MAAEHDLSWPELLWRPNLSYWLGALCGMIYLPDRSHLRNAFAALGHSAVVQVSEPGEARFVPVAIADYGDWTVIVVRGTNDPPQLFYQLASSGQRLSAPYPGKVMNAFADIGEEAWGRLQPLLPAADSGPRKYIITGHSLGGAVAQVLSFRLNVLRPGQIESVVVFGCPRVGDVLFAVAPLDWSMIRFVNEPDPVPWIPPPVYPVYDVIEREPGLFFYRHAGVSWTMNTPPGSVEYRPGDGETPTLSLLDAFGISSVGEPGQFAHYPDSYLRILRRQVSEDYARFLGEYEWVRRTDLAVAGAYGLAGTRWAWFGQPDVNQDERLGVRRTITPDQLAADLAARLRCTGGIGGCCSS